MERAIQFYGNVFGCDFEREILDGYDMAFFPCNEGQPGITGALAKGDVYKPTRDGMILYFNTDDIDTTLATAVEMGAKILYPKTINADYAIAVAEIEDSEGNRIAFRQAW